MHLVGGGLYSDAIWGNSGHGSREAITVIAMGEYFQRQDPERRAPKAPPWRLIILCLVWLFSTFTLIGQMRFVGLILAAIGWLLIAAFFIKPLMDGTDPR